VQQGNCSGLRSLKINCIESKITPEFNTLKAKIATTIPPPPSPLIPLEEYFLIAVVAVDVKMVNVG
jgi:hypothetical protein